VQIKRLNQTEQLSHDNKQKQAIRSRSIDIYHRACGEIERGEEKSIWGYNETMRGSEQAS
jgi:hypothetical protein